MKKVFLNILAVLIICVFAISIPAAPAEASGYHASGTEYTVMSTKKPTIKKKNGKYYYYNNQGKRVTKSGWKKINNTSYVYVGKQGYVTYRLYKKNGKMNYTKWNTGKKRFVKVTSYKNKIYKVNGKYYYFDKKGNIVTSAGWKQINKKNAVCVGKQGYVTYRLYRSNGKVNYTKWNGKKFTKVTSYKNGVKKINGSNYYFDGGGSILSSDGWYGTYNFDRYGRDDFVYIDKNGCVTYKFYKNGNKYYYLKWNGKKFTKVTDCKNTVLVMEDDIEFYIDENGNISDEKPKENSGTGGNTTTTPDNDNECTHDNKQNITINWYYPEVREPEFQPIYRCTHCGNDSDTPEEADEHMHECGYSYWTGYYDYDRIIGWTVKAAAHVEKNDSGYGGWKCPDCGKVEYTKLFIEDLIYIKNDDNKLSGKYYCYDKDGNPISGTQYNDVAWVRTNYYKIWNDEYQSILDAGLKQYPELKDYQPTY